MHLGLYLRYVGASVTCELRDTGLGRRRFCNKEPTAQSPANRPDSHRRKRPELDRGEARLQAGGAGVRAGPWRPRVCVLLACGGNPGRRERSQAWFQTRGNPEIKSLGSRAPGPGRAEAAENPRRKQHEGRDAGGLMRSRPNSSSEWSKVGRGGGGHGETLSGASARPASSQRPGRPRAPVSMASPLFSASWLNYKLTATDLLWISRFSHSHPL